MTVHIRLCLISGVVLEPSLLLAFNNQISHNNKYSGLDIEAS
jgi:hypothetical protein